jgi:hypothetical protein
MTKQPLGDASVIEQKISQKIKSRMNHACVNHPNRLPPLVLGVEIPPLPFHETIYRCIHNGKKNSQNSRRADQDL